MSSAFKNLNIKGVGRGALLQALAASMENACTISSNNPNRQQQEAIGVPLTRNTLGASSSEAGNMKTSPTSSNSDSEKHYEKLNLVSNCVRLLKLDNVEIYEYEVCFWPRIESQAMKRQFLDIALEEINVTRSVFSFDCTKLRVPKKLSEMELTSVVAKLPNTENEFSTVVIFKYSGFCPISEIIELYHDVFHSVFNKLNMHHFTRNYFHAKHIVHVPIHRVEVWQGYDIGIQECESGFLLQCDVISKVVHSNSVMDFLTKCYYKNKSTFRSDFESQIKGHSVMTRYNPKSYRVDDITWDMNPTSTFVLSNGETLPFVEYYKRTYDVEIKDEKQPLLIHRKVLKGDTTDAASEPQLIFLIPELCYLMGITDEMRDNIKLMQDINFLTRVSPNLHKTRVLELVESIFNNEETKALLSDWGLSFDTSLIQTSGRLLKPEVLTIGGNSMVEVNSKASWAKDIEGERVLSSVPLKQWAVIFADTDAKIVREFCKVICNTFFNMGVENSGLLTVEVPSDDIDSYLRSASELYFDTDVQLLVFVVPDDFENAPALKTFCLETGVAFHVIRLGKISDNQKLQRVTQEISRHIICKLRGELWSVHIPSTFNGTMVCGIDTYTRQDDSNIVGFVASFNRSFTKWHSTVAYQQDNEELIDCITENIIEGFKKYIKSNKALPDKIVVYRSGVPDSLLDHVLNYEIGKLKETLLFLKEGFAPEIVVIVVQKTKTRLYLDTRISNEGMDNPLPGTVIDHEVTSGRFNDFLLITRYFNQGLVSPTRYIIMCNTSILNLRDLQSLTYKLSHLCFKQPYSAAFPAPIMYAHDVALYYLEVPQDDRMVVFNDTFFFF